ncbi:colanic acid biosynthesis fucosyltransferase WcaI [soil metagenome]
MSKRVLVIGINFTPEPTGIGKYTAEMVDWFSNNGFECTVVTSFPYYPHWVVQPPYTGRSYKKELLRDGNVEIYRCPLFVPQIPSGGRRMIHEATFFVSSFLAVLRQLFRPKHDYIFCVAPPFHMGLLGLFYRMFRRGKLVYHVQDLQVDAAKELGMLKSGPLLRFLFKLEKFIMRRADKVSTISRGMIRKIKVKAEREVLFCPNWVDTEQFFPTYNKNNSRKDWGFADNDKIILYSGSIGEKQGLESIIGVAEELKNDPSFKFIICGSGPYKEKLQQLTESQNLSNIIFYPLQPVEKLNDFFNLADVHLVIQKAGASDLVMPSKLSAILSVGGLAIITANPGTGLFEEVKQYNMGILGEAENVRALLDSIRHAIYNDHDKIKVNARRYAENHLTIDRVMTDFVQTL